jgi:hypothetical protein
VAQVKTAALDRTERSSLWPIELGRRRRNSWDQVAGDRWHGKGTAKQMSDKTKIEWTDVLKIRFWSHVRIGEANECWPWMASSNGYYGSFRIQGKTYMAHRLALELKLQRPIRIGFCCLHNCDWTLCTNGAHLFEGTQIDNLHDCREKGRAFQKLSDRDVRTIRRSYIPRVVSLELLAGRFGVTKQQIWHIVKGLQR